LVRIWGEKHACVVSFNYDLLVEQSTRNQGVGVFNGSMNTMFEFSGNLNGLWKLHGSLDLVWRPGKPSTIKSVGNLAIPWEIDDFEKNGYAPFIVPPTTSKTDWYDADVLAFPWVKFRRALETMDEIVLIGFSVADADYAVNGLLHETIVPRQKDVVVCCVGRDDNAIDGICERLNRIGIRVDRTRCVAGVANYVRKIAP
jgi:hypothetical protein